jgi:hypothetical protein
MDIEQINVNGEMVTGVAMSTSENIDDLPKDVCLLRIDGNDEMDLTPLLNFSKLMSVKITYAPKVIISKELQRRVDDGKMIISR